VMSRFHDVRRKGKRDSERGKKTIKATFRSKTESETPQLKLVVVVGADASTVMLFVSVGAKVASEIGEDEDAAEEIDEIVRLGVGEEGVVRSVEQANDGALEVKSVTGEGSGALVSVEGEIAPAKDDPSAGVASDDVALEIGVAVEPMKLLTLVVEIYNL
jgi:hypothetical protein